MEDRIKKRGKIASYIINIYFICILIYFLVLKFILKVDSAEYSILEKLSLLSAPLAEIVISVHKKIYYATVFWIVFGLIGIIGLFFL